MLHVRVHGREVGRKEGGREGGREGREVRGGDREIENEARGGWERRRKSRRKCEGSDGGREGREGGFQEGGRQREGKVMEGGGSEARERACAVNVHVYVMRARACIGVGGPGWRQKQGS